MAVRQYARMHCILYGMMKMRVKKENDDRVKETHTAYKLQVIAEKELEVAKKELDKQKNNQAIIDSLKKQISQKCE